MGGSGYASEAQDSTTGPISSGYPSKYTRGGRKRRKDACNQVIRLPLRWVVFLVMFAFSVVLINELAFPQLNLLPIKTNLDITNLFAITNPTQLNLASENIGFSFTAVGFKDCPDLELNHNILLEAESVYRKISPEGSTFELKSVEIPSKEEFKTWLSQRQDANQVPPFHLTSPVNFVTINGIRSFIGGVEELISFLKNNQHFKNISLESFELTLQMQIMSSKLKEKPQTTEETEGEEILYEEIFNQNYLEVQPVNEPPPHNKVLEHFEKVGSIVPKLKAQVDLSKRKELAVTAFRKNEEKTVTNYKVLWQYLMTKGGKFKWRAPALASVIFVQDQLSAQQALKYKNSIVNNIGMGGQSCFGGSKGAQLRCRMELTTRDGCNYDTLKIQPPQYRFWIPEECNAFFDTFCSASASNETSEDADAEDFAEKLWIEKPSAGQHGVGMKVHRGCVELKAKYGSCVALKSTPKRKKWFVMEYLDPALIHGHKFDLRSYLLVASLDPLVAFYHDGFIRKAGSVYNTNASSIKDAQAHITNAIGQEEVDDHIWDFRRLENYLVDQLQFPQGYITKRFREHAIKVENFVLQASRKAMFRKKGAFQLFALDWIIAADGGIHMLEANSNPLVMDYGVEGFPETWESMMDLLLMIHNSPEEIVDPLVTVPKEKRFGYRGWDLVFNELEEKALGLEYNACDSLSSLTNTASSNHFENFQNSKHEDKMLQELQKKLDIEVEALEQETELQHKRQQSEEEAEKLKLLSPLEAIQRSLTKTTSEEEQFSLEDYNCQQVNSGENFAIKRCLLAENTEFETYFYVLGENLPADAPTVMVVSGVHGNEPSGVVASRHLRRHWTLEDARLVVVERVNAVGVKRSQRYLNEQKKDLNRVFPSDLSKEPTHPLAKYLWALVEATKPNVFFDFHEGWGLYSLTKDNENPTGQLVGNRKFSKGSSIISSQSAWTVSHAATREVNQQHALLTRLEPLLENGTEVFSVSGPPIEGGLARRVAERLDALAFVQETTSREGGQSLDTRAKQHLVLFAAAVKELGLDLKTGTEIDKISEITVEKCVAGRKNCKIVHPGDEIVETKTPELESLKEALLEREALGSEVEVKS